MSRSSSVTNQMMASVSLAQIRANKMVFPMALLGWPWKLNIVITEVFFVKWFFIPLQQFTQMLNLCREVGGKLIPLWMVDVFLVTLVGLSAFWLYLPSWAVQSQQ